MWQLSLSLTHCHYHDDVGDDFENAIFRLFVVRMRRDFPLDQVVAIMSVGRFAVNRTVTSAIGNSGH